jgi:hypothetical protein
MIMGPFECIVIYKTLKRTDYYIVELERKGNIEKN